MKKYIETLGGIIEKQAAVSPDKARGLLTAAYSWVRFSGKHRTGSDVGSAYDRMNSAVAGTIVDSFRRPKEAVMVNIFLPCELLHALGIQPMFPEGIAVYAACTACQRFFGEAAEASGVPETFCSYHKTMLGMAESGVLPAPLMIANTTLACDANQLSFRRLAELYQVPHTVIDVPHDCGEEAVHYVADQMRTLGGQLEEQSHRKLEPQALREAVARSRQTIETYRAYLAKRGGVTLPVTMTGELCSMISTHVMLGRPESMDYVSRLLRAAENAPDTASSGKKHIFWMHTLPNWQDSLRDILETGGRCELAGSDMPAGALLDMDPDRPYESMARRVVCSAFNGPASHRVEEAVRRAKEVRADGVILFCHWGCKQTLGLSQMAKQRLEEEGLPTLVLDGEEKDFELAESLTHANLYCHAKALIQQGARTEELALMDCCDSLRRTYDVLCRENHQKFLRLVDLPHEDGVCARERFKGELIRLGETYGAYQGTSFDRNAFLAACRESAQPLPEGPFLAVLGARASPSLLDLIQKGMPLPVVNLTCSGNRDLEPPPEGAEDMDFDALMAWYAGALLGVIPCMRMTSVAGRRALTSHPRLKGVIYNTVKFCDFYSFDYAALKRESDLPVLKIESDYMPQPAGQLATRLEAFAESLFPNVPDGRKKSMETEGLYAGIDSGSTTTNIVVINEKKEVRASAIVRTGAKAQNGAKAALDSVCGQLNCRPEDFAAILATGYGRNNIPFATGTKTEITCHARGASFLNPSVRTIVDIGGQDSKVICLDGDGGVANFIMNDKCAAGTGRFLEMMARTLELDMEQMSQRGLTWKKDLTISSMCTVFAESEVISLIADNHTDSDIIHGLNKSIAVKTASMVSRSKGAGPYMMTGGVARNRGVVQELEKRLGERLFIADDPDLCGALGAALYALEES